ncbi:MAG: hypothetical protein EA339_08715 [Rhodobacteraceae bacterium]|nr:MAG: hypothetical protein EA339_08715 [Paracoccaceae bacterium]
MPEHLRQSRAEPGCLNFRVFLRDQPLVWHVEERFRNQAAIKGQQARQMSALPRRKSAGSFC